jgi:O-succinylbenzoic acid--CoA ligase
LVINAPKVSDNTIVTNDVVQLISSTEFKWLGRYDNVINSGGVKVHPENIEKILSNFINDPFFIAGIDDEVLGQKVVLVIEGNFKEDFLKIVNTIQEFQKFEKPKMVLTSKKFQRTDSGKIQRSKTLEQILKAY